ncbi:SnoaL-like domain-containing protein [Ferruginibacter albus]|uniref:SnoaL-like domain-containing protein n=1 Tax=Ferruginibacter albus TaxID=2875540 RepID=UPI001CC7709F|nr:SnoaL-like domain-containing protein [Ferruginibacter albus]UAY53446.1 nuclear transport factor 2 family protein [Ferruginibacter albus]
MSTQEVANRLYELCQQGQFKEAQQELYAPEITSTESTPTGERITVKGMEGLAAKAKQFNEMVEAMHGGYTKEPTVFGKYIFMEMGMDVTMKGMGRMNMVELARYEVNNGKIVAEEFYY